MGTARDNKTKRGRISHSTRAIFYENLERGLGLWVPGAVKADRIRFLMDRARLSRTHAQRLVNGQEADDAQAPSIDTLAFIAEAFEVTAAEFLTQGCKFAMDRNQRPAVEHATNLGRGVLQRPSSRASTTRRRAG